MPLCPEEKEYNPSTKRCVKKCKSGYSRDRSFKCKKTRAASKRSSSSSSSSKNRTKRSKSSSSSSSAKMTLDQRARVNALKALAKSNIPDLARNKALLDKIDDVKWERESYAQELKDAYNHRVEMGIIKTSAERKREKQVLNKQLSDIQRELKKTINDVKSAHGL